MLKRVAEAALLSPPFSTLSYTIPAGFPEDCWKPGLRLAVPLGRGLRQAILLRVTAQDSALLAQQSFALKEILWPLEQTPLLSENYLDFARQFALRQAQPIGRVLSGMLPAGLRVLKQNLRLRFYTQPKLDFDLRAIRELDAERRAALAQVWGQGLGKVLKPKESGDDELYLLTTSPPWPVRPNAVKQLQLLELFVSASGSSQMTRRQITGKLGQDAAPVLKQLVAKGLLELQQVVTEQKSSATEREKSDEAQVWLEQYRPILASGTPFCLNKEQTDALDDFTRILHAGKFASRLLYGVTGSGKTAVYLEFWLNH